DCVHSGRDAVTLDLEGTSADGTYVSDWVFTPGSGDLDECNGAFVDGEYVYFITNDYPYIPPCLMGEATAGAGGPSGAAPGAGPKFNELAAALGVTVDELQAVLPPPGEALDDSATALGVTVEELITALPTPPR
ncbi:MAG: YHYH protein, partial [Acidimicrobiales bacterium]|nr:YHYH protein [Acidimicrobiales bacterium]